MCSLPKNIANLCEEYHNPYKEEFKKTLDIISHPIVAVFVDLEKGGSILANMGQDYLYGNASVSVFRQPFRIFDVLRLVEYNRQSGGYKHLCVRLTKRL